MYYFTNDYSEGAHPLIMQKLLETNMEQTDVYGSDQYCANAKALIKTACGREDADVHLFIGGTQTNFTIISAALRPFQGVYSSFLGHINTHCHHNLGGLTGVVVVACVLGLAAECDVGHSFYANRSLDRVDDIDYFDVVFKIAVAAG